ncbi:hypothetical protein KR49_00115 [Synechococcus sp. KORDI-49]|nr:hypothetical protein KR49_00115 [Synechococcus sp. KORDI-49]
MIFMILKLFSIIPADSHLLFLMRAILMLVRPLVYLSLLSTVLVTR